MLVAFYGGSFNPPHVAHVLAATYLLGTGGFDRVLVVPVFSHAFDKRLASFDDRVVMCELAMAWIPGVEVSRVEETLGTPSYTLNTLRALASQYPGARFRLVIGSDVLRETDKWLAFDAVSALAPPFVLGRAGAPRDDAPPPLLPDISSTRVRELCARRGSPEADRELERVVPKRVLAYIDEHGLYR